MDSTLSGGANSEAVPVQLAHILKYLKQKCKLDFIVSFSRLKVLHTTGKIAVTEDSRELSTLKSRERRAEEARPRQTLERSLGRSLGRDLLRTIVTVNGPVLPFPATYPTERTHA